MSVRELEKIETRNAPPRGRTGAAIALAFLLAIGLAAGSYAIGRAGRSVSPANRPALDQVAVARLVAGISRPQDGLLYGEWVRDRILKRCPAFAAADIILVPGHDGSGWIVTSQFIDGTKIKGPCSEADEIEDVAFVSADGQVERIPVHWGGPRVIGPNHEEILPTVPQGGALIDHFRSGEAP